MKKVIVVLLVGGVLVTAAQPATTRAAPRTVQEIQVDLHARGNSGISGLVDLQQLKPSGTHITVNAFGLMPRRKYVSLNYDNAVCHLEPYSRQDIVGHIYTANAGGVGTTAGNADTNLAQINSVSVRAAGTFALLACATVHASKG